MGENGNSSGTKQERADRVRLVGDIICSESLNASVAMRLSQFDNDMELMLWVASHIAKLGVFVWLDVEKMDSVDNLLIAYRIAALGNPKLVGIALQAYLNRTLHDLEELIKFSQYNRCPIYLRPVRGVYVYEADIKDLQLMHQNLARMMHMIETCGVEFVHQYPASHHPEQIARAILLQRKVGTHISAAQVLMGVYKDGGKMHTTISDRFEVPLEVYEPFGPHTAAYIKRRNQEAGGTMRGLVRAGLRERSNAGEVVRLVTLYDVDTTDPLLPFIPRSEPVRGCFR